MTGTWAGERLRGSASGHIFRDTLVLWGNSPGGDQGDREMLVFVAYRGAGEYRLEGGQGSMQYVQGGDAILATYAVPADRPGMLVIEQAEDGTISGHVSFDAVHAGGRQPAGSGGRFTGRFRSVPLVPLMSTSP